MDRFFSGGIVSEPPAAQVVTIGVKLATGRCPGPALCRGSLAAVSGVAR